MLKCVYDFKQNGSLLNDKNSLQVPYNIESFKLCVFMSCNIEWIFLATIHATCAIFRHNIDKPLTVQYSLTCGKNKTN